MAQHPFNYSIVKQALAAFGRETDETLPARLAPIPGTRLAELRDAVRYFASIAMIPAADAARIESAVTAEITRRWA